MILRDARRGPNQLKFGPETAHVVLRWARDIDKVKAPQHDADTIPDDHRLVHLDDLVALLFMHCVIATFVAVRRQMRRDLNLQILVADPGASKPGKRSLIRPLKSGTSSKTYFGMFESRSTRISTMSSLQIAVLPF